MRFSGDNTLFLTFHLVVYLIGNFISVDNGKSCCFFTKMADTTVVGNPDGPGYKAAVVKVVAFIEGIDDLYEHILEYIFRQTSVFYQQHDGCKDPVLVSVHKYSKCTVVAGSVQSYEFFICQVTIAVHVFIFLKYRAKKMFKKTGRPG
jgi:hypothetical protein